MSLKDFFVEYQLSDELFSIKGVHDDDYKVIKKRCGYCFTENDVKTFMGSAVSEQGTLDFISADLSFKCCDCGKTNNQYDKVIVEGRCKGCNGVVRVPYFLSQLYDEYPVFLEDISKYGYILFENYDNNDCIRLCTNTKEENDLTILETRNVQVYDFQNRDNETKYGFVMKFQEKDEVYTPYLTNSRAAIGLFIDPIDFAELIQDEGSKYTVTPNAIVFEDRESANIAADVLYEQLRHISINKVEAALYEFSKNNHFGKKPWFEEQLRQPNQCDGSDIPSVVLEAAYQIYVAARENNLQATVYGGNEDKTYSIVSYNLTTGELETDENCTVHVRDVIQLNIDVDLSFATWYQ